MVLLRSFDERKRQIVVAAVRQVVLGFAATSRGGGRLVLFQVVQRQVDYAVHVFVVKAVVDFLAHALVAYST